MRESTRGICSRSAFSLVELLIVILVIAICAAVVVPMAAGTDDLQVVSAARIVASDLQYAQNAAISSQQPVTVIFTPATETYSLSNASGPLIHPMTKEAWTVNLADQSGFDKVDMASASFGSGASVEFDEMGSPDNAGTVTLQSGAHVYTVSVAAATGKVTVTCVGQ